MKNLFHIVKCSACQSELVANDQFCNNCGTKVVSPIQQIHTQQTSTKQRQSSHSAPRQPVAHSTQNLANQPKKLYRSGKNRLFLGVLGGLAEYLNSDPSIVRVLFVLISLMSGGMAVIAYFIFAIVIPENPNDPWKPNPVNY